MRTRPAKFCDVIMKGGITSGVVYPHAILQLKDRYRFKNIGGSSAGAIAAAMTAAAEYGRDEGGFEKLERATGGISRSLVGLFQPAPVFRPVFDAFLGSLGAGPKSRKILRVLGTIVRHYGAEMSAALVPGLAMTGYAWYGGRGWEAWLVALLVLLALPLLTLVFRLYRVAFGDLEENRYGMCSGMATDGEDDEALTEWLTRNLDEIAGVQDRREPLTFGDLQGGDPAHPDLNLKMMTTNLTVGEPHVIPLRKRIYMFRKSEFDQLFPARVVDHMVAHTHRYPDTGQDFYFLPRTADLPVVVAVRLSLSFPVLLQAVPLYARDFTFNQEHADKRKLPLRCWFSDGGITSNFPIHLFDGIWPRWPTFGITLGKFDDQRHTTDVWMPRRASQGVLSEFKGIGGLGSFLWSIFTTAQNWRDNLQSIQPGCRERIVRIALADGEGGLNLAMDEERIEEMFDKGRRAGAAIGEFDFDAHRWKRYLVSLDQLQELFPTMKRTYEDRENGRLPLREFLASYENTPGMEYRPAIRWWPAARRETAKVMQTADDWDEEGLLEKGNYPRPRSKLRGRYES